MKSASFRFAMLVAAGGLTLTACGQDHTTPIRSLPLPSAAQPAQPTQDPNSVKFESLVRRDADGKTIPLEGIIDLYSLHRNPTIDEAAWQKITPIVVEWMTDVDNSVIDNLDFVEKLDSGMLNEVDVMDMNTNRMIMEMMMQFLSIGPATTILEQRGALTRLQSMVNTNIGNDYLQKMLDETRQEAQEQAKAQPQDKQEAFTVNATSKFIFNLMWRDAKESYKRQLDEAAPNLDKLIDGLRLESETASEVKQAAQKVKVAAAGDARRKAMKETLQLMPFDKRRELLRKARDLAPPFNPRTAYVPPPPQPTQPAPAAGATDATNKPGR